MKYTTTQILVLTLLVSVFTSCKNEEFYEKDFIETIADKHQGGDSIITLPGEVDADEVAQNDSSDSNDSNDGSDSNNGNDGSDSNNGNDGSDSNDGSDGNNGNDDQTVYEDVKDEFIQKEEGHKLDILWVIDNSGSMQDEQEALGRNFDAFIQDFSDKGIDFKMAITTTDTSNTYAGSKGTAVDGSIEKLSSTKLDENRDQFLNDFEKLINVGINGSGYERGIQASAMFSEQYKNDFIRDDAYLAVVYVTDEDDQSQKSVDEYYSELTSLKNNAGFLKVFSIVSYEQSENSNYINYGHERYKKLTDKANGSMSDIQGDFHQMLSEMGKQISQLAVEFPLSQTPADANELKVYVNQLEDSSWSYNAQTNSISFANAPIANSKIEISYKVEK